MINIKLILPANVIFTTNATSSTSKSVQIDFPQISGRREVNEITNGSICCQKCRAATKM